MSDMTARIAKLLELAEKAATSAEAEAAFAKAQELATKFAIDMEVARRSHAPKERQRPERRNVVIGEKGKRANASLVRLYSNIAAANDVTILIAYDSTVVYGHGVPSDLDAVEALWASLATTMTRLGDELVRDKNAAWRQETVRVWSDSAWDYVDKKVSGQGARRSFYDSFTYRIGQRLKEAREASIKEADNHFHNEEASMAAVFSDSGNLPSSTALVLKEKRKEVEEFMYDDYKRRHGGRKPGTWRGGQSSGTRSSSASDAGRRAADSVNLSGRKAVGA